jgi:hypothetical protein
MKASPLFIKNSKICRLAVERTPCYIVYLFVIIDIIGIIQNYLLRVRTFLIGNTTYIVAGLYQVDWEPLN